MKKLLITHIWFGTPYDNWYNYLKVETMKLGYDVYVPQLVDKDNPTLEDWTNSALKDYKLDKDTSIVGHSLGAVLAMKLVQNSTVKIDTLVLVSGWDYWDLTPAHKSFFEIPIDHERIINNTKKIVVVHSTNDPYTTVVQAEKMAKRFHADFLKIENGVHFQSKSGFSEFPQLVELFAAK